MNAKSIRHTSGILLIICAVILALITCSPEKESIQELNLDASNFFSQRSQHQIQGQIKITSPPSTWLGSTQPVKVMLLFSNVPEETQLEARLALAGVRLEPGREIQTRLLPEKPITVIWQITTYSTGIYPGTIWLHARISENNQEQPSNRILLAAIPIQIKGKAIFGLTQQETQFTIGVCLLIGVALLSDMIWKAIQKVITNYYQSDQSKENSK